jgi:glyceraldehyde 3-phosphate dehydrogenase (phosphorylating)
MTRVGVNGFGRIGRCFFRAAKEAGVEIVAVNDVVNAATLVHLLKYDSVFGKLRADVKVSEDGFSVDGKAVRVLTARDPGEIPWSQMDVDIVVESTGLFTKRELAAKHLTAGARKVLISAPADRPDVTIVPGVNSDKYDPTAHKIVSMASCTTNCVAPIAKVIHELCSIRHGFMTTVHAYTGEQRLLDAPHRDLRRARAAALSIIPTTTGAARSVADVIPELKGKLDGVALRVPVPDASIADLVASVEAETTVDSINDAFRKTAQGPMSRIIEFCEDPIVSSDVIRNPHSTVFDSRLTMVLDRKLVKVFAWYDNEWGYSNRLVDMIQLMSHG